MVDTFRDYLLHGWVLCDVPAGSKGPRTKGWNTKDGGIRDPGRGPALRGAGLCHRWSKTCAVDVDNLEEARDFLAGRGIDLDALLSAADAVQIHSGRPGRAKLLYALPEPLASLKVAPYTVRGDDGKPKTFHALELRCASAEGLSVQDVLPGTIHPDTGRPYEWRYGSSPLAHWSNLPPLPQPLHELWLAHLGPTPAERAPEVPKGAEFTEINDLLDGESPDCDYDTWYKIGAALHHETRGSAEGFEAWHAWSAKGGKYKSRADLVPHWDSFRAKADNPITLGWLRARKTARAADFPIEGPSGSLPPDAQAQDNRPDAIMQREVGEKLIYVRQLDQYFDKAERTLFPTDRAVRNAFCPILPNFNREGKNGKKDTYKLDPVNWLQNSPERKKHDVWSVAMHPGAEITFEDRGVRYANSYRPTKALCAVNPDVPPLVPKPCETEAFHFLWSRMESKGFQQWLMMFYAYAMRNPGVKIRCAPLLVSKTTGTGKSTIMAEIPRLLFGHVEQLTEDEIRRGWNDNLLHAWWATIEEIYAGVSKSERNAFANRVKPWVSNNDLAINKRGNTAFTIPNRTQFTASSNHEDALQLDDDEERRWGVCAVKEAQWKEGERMGVYRDFLETDRAPGVLKYIFNQVNLTGFSPSGKPPITSAKTAMVAVGLGNWEATLVERMAAQEEPFHRDLFRLRDVLGSGYYGALTTHKLASVLRGRPFECVPLHKNARTEKFWVWRNHAQWAKCTEGERKIYIENGVRPAGTWSDAVPTPILAMTPEGIGEVDLPDLVGDV